MIVLPYTKIGFGSQDKLKEVLMLSEYQRGSKRERMFWPKRYIPILGLEPQTYSILSFTDSFSSRILALSGYNERTSTNLFLGNCYAS